MIYLYFFLVLAVCGPLIWDKNTKKISNHTTLYIKKIKMADFVPRIWVGYLLSGVGNELMMECKWRVLMWV